ncbi:MBL fold metallo-hydrolase [Leeia aquatica]|uniref:3',5'-cyclic-nucleotide phosphodiesterase n=1 Tax=Leeia aquatica TaxID=2725557 RepID=A0A847S8P5_9NEIS|nr:3',5'-cyclic-nucleotide phosphodiesterase [Leeia aquatica]NLR75225.1 3',5'-cyclic-nucleotide phosphodiesterase [Leeia aquatica]
MTEIRVLGCSGGIGGPLRTTSFLVDQHVLIDAGTGVADLSLAELALVDRVFLTHSHLDHIAMLPLMLDSVGAMRNQPLEVLATSETIAILQQHIFNWQVWPDFSQIPDPQHPFLRFTPIQLGQTIALGRHARLQVLPAEHTVPAVAYALRCSKGSWVFSGDTVGGEAFWRAVNALPDLRYLIMETAFCVREAELARLSKHLSPDTLAEQLACLQLPVELYITHLKPGELELTMQEIHALAARWQPRMLQAGHVFSL